MKSALSPCPRRRIAYIRMCSDMVCYSGTIQGCCTHCHFRNNKPYLSTSAHTVPPPWRKKESFLRDSRPCSFARKEVTHGPLRCAYVPLYASGMDSHAHGLSVFPTLVVVGALMLKRWIVQYGSSKLLIDQTRYWTIHRFNMSTPTTTRLGRNESPCAWLSTALS